MPTLLLPSRATFLSNVSVEWKRSVPPTTDEPTPTSSTTTTTTSTTIPHPGAEGFDAVRSEYDAAVLLVLILIMAGIYGILGRLWSAGRMGD